MDVMCEMPALLKRFFFFFDRWPIKEDFIRYTLMGTNLIPWPIHIRIGKYGFTQTANIGFYGNGTEIPFL